MVRFMVFICIAMFCAIDGYSQIEDIERHELKVIEGKENRYRLAANSYSFFIRNINNTMEDDIDCMFYKGGFCGYVTEWPDRREDIQHIVNSILQPYKDQINNSRYKEITITFYLPITGGEVKEISFSYNKGITIPIIAIEQLEKALKEKITFHIYFDTTSKLKPLRNYTSIAIEGGYSVK